MKNLSLLAPIAALVCAAVVCGAVLLWAPVCAGMLELTNGNMVPMRCTYTAKVELLLALILAVVAVVALVTKRPMTVALVLLSLAIVLLTFDTPLSIGACETDSLLRGIWKMCLSGSRFGKGVIVGRWTWKMCFFEF